MKEAFEKILERLEKYENNDLIEHDSEECEHCKRIDCEIGMTCSVCIMDKAISIVQEVAEEYNDGWIPCSVRLPEEHDSIFAKLKGTDKWYDAMFEKISDDVNVTVEFEDGTRKTMTLHTNDGKWNTGNRIAKFNVIAWQPLPEPYKGE